MEIPDLVPVDNYDARQVSCFVVHMIEELLSYPKFCVNFKIFSGAALNCLSFLSNLFQINYSCKHFLLFGFKIFDQLWVVCCWQFHFAKEQLIVLC